jgi:DNA topoisomerase II
MPLWSLTQERVEKLRRQIGDIEREVDKLIKLSKEDLWKMDLDLFIEEWRTQLDEEHQRKRRINNMGRRTSQKVKVVASGPSIKKRKGLGDDEDDDFEDRPKAKKPAPPKVKRTEVIVEKSKEPLLKTWLSGNGTQGKNPAKYHDGNSSEVEPEPAGANDIVTEAKKAKPAPQKKTLAVPDDSEEEEVVATKPVARKGRAAASKPIRYAGGSDSDGSNGDDLLGDITNMVKGLPGGETKPSTDSKSLFSTSRALPNGSTSLKPAPPAATKTYAEISDDDDTNFMGLVPQHSPRRSINVTKNAELTDEEEEDEDDVRPLTTSKARSQASAKPSKPAPPEKARFVVKSESESEDDDDDNDIVFPKSKSRPAQPSKPAAAPKRSKPALKPTAAAKKKEAAPKKAKTAPAPVTKKAPHLSPAAKAYAVKQAKNLKKNRLLDSDDDDDEDDNADGAIDVDAMADDLLDSPIRPRAAAASGKEEGDSNLEDSSPAPAVVVRDNKKKKNAATTAYTTTTSTTVSNATGRPARRAAVQKKKPVYVLSDDEEDEDDSGVQGFGIEDGDDDDSEVEADFDESE